ncbi:MAG: hypothetical protein KJO08_09010, partial [Gammaproteobacteria bacterium]|nr:hypothetical protein [Gammaproteobacteria bacterium]
MSSSTDSEKNKTPKSPEKLVVRHSPIGGDHTAGVDRTEIPLRPQATRKVASEDDAVRMLRGFYLGKPDVPDPEEAVDGRYLPAFLGPYRDEPA